MSLPKFVCCGSPRTSTPTNVVLNILTRRSQKQVLFCLRGELVCSLHNVTHGHENGHQTCFSRNFALYALSNLSISEGHHRTCVAFVSSRFAASHTGTQTAHRAVSRNASRYVPFQISPSPQCQQKRPSNWMVFFVGGDGEI